MQRETFGQVLKAATGMEKFFGAPLTSVNVLLLQMAIDDGGPPDWLRGRTRIEVLPRYVAAEQAAVVVPADGITTSQIADRMRWIIENIAGAWSISEAGFHFLDGGDAVHYSLAFRPR